MGVSLPINLSLHLDESQPTICCTWLIGGLHRIQRPIVVRVLFYIYIKGIFLLFVTFPLLAYFFLYSIEKKMKAKFILLQCLNVCDISDVPEPRSRGVIK